MPIFQIVVEEKEKQQEVLFGNMQNENWVKYTNGNYSVFLNLKNGTKIRENEESFFNAEFPESADVKITNRCSNGCPFCHENSTKDGKHSDALHSPVWESFHPYTECSLGGGNLMEYPDLVPLLERLKTLKLIPNITVHQWDFEKNFDLIKKLSDEKLIYGLGVSLDKVTPEFIDKMKQFPNGVIHVINGIVTGVQLRALAHNDLKILILGYKNVRRGSNLYHSNVGYAIDGRKDLMYDRLEEILKENWFKVVSFDNLAIKQLKPQRLVSEDYWNTCFMGDDGIDGQQTSASMYIDLVENEFARNSCDVSHRFKIKDKTVTEMYQFLKGLK